jgi:acyl-CoA dehydrogenase
MSRPGYSEEHEQFRRTARAFLDKELEPNYKAYTAKGGVDKEFWRKAGQAGLLGLCIPEEYGGPGAEFTYNVILAEELGASVGSAYTGSTIMADVASYILMGHGTSATAISGSSTARSTSFRTAHRPTCFMWWRKRTPRSVAPA